MTQTSARKYLFALPLCALLLLGASKGKIDTSPLTEIDVSTFRPNYSNNVDYFVISAVKKDTPTSFIYCFSTSSLSSLEIDLYFVDTKSEVEQLIHTSNVSRGRILRGSFTYLETNNESYYSNNDWGGPSFKAVFKYGTNTITKTYKARYSLKTYNYATLDDKEATLVSDDSIMVASYMRGTAYLSESFKFAIISDEIDLTGDNSLGLDFSYLELLNCPITGVSFPTYNSSMTLVDMHGHFRDDVKEHGGVPYPGEFVLDGNYLKYDHTPTYYIDPVTRIIYKDNAVGRLLTKRVYYPLGAYQTKMASEYKDFPGYLITTASFGFSKVSISAVLSIYISSDNLIGACYSSGYCITSTESRSDIE